MLLMLVGLLLGAPPAGSLESYPALADSAVVEGSAETLSEIRAALESRVGSKRPPTSTQDDRYLLAYVEWRLGQMLGPKAKKKRNRLLKEAQGHLDVYLDLGPSDPEAHALRGTVIGERIDGAFKGMFLGPKANGALKRALELAPENPRVALQRGVSFFFTPKSFGGGIEKAEAELRRAWELFQRETPDKAWPNWGRVDTLAWLGQTLAKQGKTEEARSIYRQALALEPGHRWIRDELLPALESR